MRELMKALINSTMLLFIMVCLFFRTFVMALGHPPPDYSPQAGRLFAPLILPLLVLVVTLSFYFCRQRFCPLPTADPGDVTRPLIDEIIDDDNTYPGFGEPYVTEVCENATEIHASAPNSYGAI